MDGNKSLKIQITIPDDLRFADLNMTRLPLGGVKFDWEPIERICEASGIDISVFRDSHEDNLGGLITEWYLAARENGEPADPVQEQIIAEVRSEYN